MNTLSHDDCQTIDRLIAAAATAATKGEWGQVDQLYHQREAFLSHASVPPELASRLLAVDCEITERIKVAQAGLTSLMDDAARLRQRIQGLRRWNGARSSDSGTIERHV